MAGLGKEVPGISWKVGFASQVLPWIKPLLAPGYVWMAAV